MKNNTRNTNFAIHLRGLGIGISAIACMTALQPSGAYAQELLNADVSTEDAITKSNEIVVIARRRSESLQDVPLAVSVVQAADLQRNGVDSVAELSLVAPALTVSPPPGGGRSSPNFAIRGLSQQELSILGDQSVSTYVGDVVVARVQGLNGALFDVSSIEVLRGPQGTLFGRNTTGGAVVLRPNQPSFNPEGMAGVTIGNLGTFNTEAMLNVPVSDTISLRVAGRTLHDNGYVYDSLLGRNVNFTKQQAARVSLLIEPNSNFSALTTYEYFHENDGGTAAYLVGINPDAFVNDPAFRAARGYRPLEDLLAEQQGRSIYEIASGTPAFNRIETHMVSNTLTYDLSDRISFKNIIAYRDVKDDLRDDLDGTESSIFPQERIDDSWQFSNEFQVIGSFDRFDWIAGLYYFKERGRLQAYSSAVAVDPGNIEPEFVPDYPDAGLSLTDIEGRNISYAAFAQGSYEVADNLKLTAGIRMTKDKRRSIIRNRLPRIGTCRFTIDADNNPATPEVTPPLSNCQVEGNDSFSEPTYNISLDYKVAPGKLVYLAHRHGYRSGGFGSRATTEAGLTRTYDPETVDDFEVGVKTDWYLGGAFLRTNLAAYHADYKDIQRVLTDASLVPVQAVTVNAGSARIRGLEAEILLRPVAWIDLNANYAYTDAQFKDFVTPNGADLSNSRFARAPKHVYTLGARISPPIPAGLGEVSFGGSFYHHGGYNADDNHIPGVSDMPSHELVNIDASWNNIMESGFDISAAVTNLTKEKYSYYIANLLGLGVLPHFAGEPRRAMVTLRYHFGQ